MANVLAAVTTSPGQMQVRQVPDPTPGDREVRVAVAAVGLCGSDYHLFAGTHPYARFPQIQGHEIAGTIDGLGPGYDGPLSVGDRVAVEPFVHCGACFACRRGRSNCCERLEVMGAHIPGALREFVVVSPERLHPVQDLTADLCALVEPLSIAVQAVERSEAAAGDRVVVLGAGPIGLGVALACSDRGAHVLVVDRLPSRLAAARRFGAEATADTSTDDVGAVVDEWTHGEGAAVVVDATGVPALIRMAVDLVAPSGVVVIVGISGEDVAVPVIAFTRKELTVRGSRNNNGLFPASIDLVRRHGQTVGSLISHRFPLSEAPEALRFAADHPDQVEKALIVMGQAS